MRPKIKAPGNTQQQLQQAQQQGGAIQGVHQLLQQQPGSQSRGHSPAILAGGANGGNAQNGSVQKNPNVNTNNRTRSPTIDIVITNEQNIKDPYQHKILITLLVPANY